MEFATEEATTAAVWCNGAMVEGREIHIRRARRRAYETIAQPNKVAVRGVPVTATHQDIEDFFTQVRFGEVW